MGQEILGNLKEAIAPGKFPESVVTNLNKFNVGSQIWRSPSSELPHNLSLSFEDKEVGAEDGVCGLDPDVLVLLPDTYSLAYHLRATGYLPIFNCCLAASVLISFEQSHPMNYLYYLANASLTLRIIEYLYGNPSIPLDFVTVIHHIDGWIVRIKLKTPLMPQRDGDVRAFLNEMGIPYQPSPRIEMALLKLQSGQSPLKVMRQFQIAIVSHGYPEHHEIEVFRQNFIEGLGYCPEHLA